MERFICFSRFFFNLYFPIDTTTEARQQELVEVASCLYQSLIVENK